MLTTYQSLSCCEAVKEFSASHADLDCQVHRKLGGDAAQTVDPNWPKGYSTPYNAMLSIEAGGSWLGGSHCCLGKAEYRSLGGEQLHFVHQLFSICIIIIVVIIIITTIFSFAFLLNCVYLSPWVFTFSHFPPHPSREKEGRREGVAVWCLAADWGYNTT